MYFDPHPYATSWDRTEVYSAFGDDSVNDCYACYGLVLIPTGMIETLVRNITNIKKQFGGRNNTLVHCREILHPHSRLKSGWKHLDQQQAENLCKSILISTNETNPLYMLGYSQKSWFPRRGRLLGRNGHEDIIFDIDSNWITLNLYYGIASNLDPVQILAPPDPVKSSAAPNQPRWRSRAIRSFDGPRVHSVHLDRAKTKLKYFRQKLQWSTLARDFVVENRTREPSFLPVVDTEEEHPLLEVADVFTYCQSRLIAGRELMFDETVLGDVYVQQVGASNPVEELVYGLSAEASGASNHNASSHLQLDLRWCLLPPFGRGITPKFKNDIANKSEFSVRILSYKWGYFIGTRGEFDKAPKPFNFSVPQTDFFDTDASVSFELKAVKPLNFEQIAYMDAKLSDLYFFCEIIYADVTNNTQAVAFFGSAKIQNSAIFCSFVEAPPWYKFEPRI